MKNSVRSRIVSSSLKVALAATLLSIGLGFFTRAALADNGPVPMLAAGHPVDWWFVFKLNAGTFPGCDGGMQRVCPFGGDVQSYKGPFGQQYVYASSENAALQKGTDCVGDTTSDPIGATFDEIYNGSLHYVVWNDQFYDDPHINGCTKDCGAPWGHSKGIVAWDDSGQGLVMQVSTPSWPAAGSVNFPRKTDGNTLGCVRDNDVEVSQHFFALKLSAGDLVQVLKALQNASVVTDPSNPQIVNNGGPADVVSLVNNLGVQSTSTSVTDDKLSTGVEVIAKPSRLAVPPWQMVSARLGGVSLRTATWWDAPQIYTTTASTNITCWADGLGTPGAVAIATTGQWNGTTFGLTGGQGGNFNHAKIGVSTAAGTSYTIFGDMNQQGAAFQNCTRSQNGRGGLFYVMTNADLFGSVTSLISGDTAPTGPPSN